MCVALHEPGNELKKCPPMCCSRIMDLKLGSKEKKLKAVTIPLCCKKN